jgi:cephalosporin-C deacetylase-like acetyl esterase
MTCNISRPYSGENVTNTMPSFSRIRKDMIFRKGDRIEIFAFPAGRPVFCAWSLCLNMVGTPFLKGDGEVCMDQSIRIQVPPEKLVPGFYTLNLRVSLSDTRALNGTAGFGYRIDEIKFTESRPADFEAFWSKAKGSLSRIPLNRKETFIREMNDMEISEYNVREASIPEKYDPQGVRAESVKLYKVQFDSAGGMRMHGWLAVPTGKGPFPGILVLPGVGCGKVPAPVEHARHGYVALMLQIHGLDVDLEKYETPKSYMKCLGGKPEDEYYYNVVLGCVQAVNYLSSRTDVDAGRLAVAGGSQGGFLSIATAALCPEIKAAASSLCYYGYWPYRDQPGTVNKDGLAAGLPSFNRSDARQNSLSYYDTMNFAPMVKSPAVMCACLCDTPSPPITVYAVFKSLSSRQKEIFWSPGTNHDLMFSFERAAWRFLDEELSKK